jgi:hypothetical protein
LPTADTGVTQERIGWPSTMHGAGAALREAAAEMRIVEPEIVAQRVEQRHVGIGVDRLDLAVHVEIYSSHGCGSPLRFASVRPPDRAEPASRAGRAFRRNCELF